VACVLVWLVSACCALIVASSALCAPPLARSCLRSIRLEPLSPTLLELLCFLQAWTSFLFAANVFFVVVFTLEAVFKLMGLGFKRYFKEGASFVPLLSIFLPESFRSRDCHCLCAHLRLACLRLCV
jgi:hypothetical protein